MLVKSQNIATVFLFSLTTNDREILEQLRPLFHHANFQVSRLTTKMQKALLLQAKPFATNASFVAWSQEGHPHALDQQIFAHIIPIALFSEGHMLRISQNTSSFFPKECNQSLWAFWQQFNF